MKIDRSSPFVLFLILGFIAAPSSADVTANATAHDALPAAIVGEAPELTGVAINYFSVDIESQGYLAIPSGEPPFGW